MSSVTPKAKLSTMIRRVFLFAGAFEFVQAARLLLTGVDTSELNPFVAAGSTSPAYRRLFTFFVVALGLSRLHLATTKPRSAALHDSALLLHVAEAAFFLREAASPEGRAAIGRAPGKTLPLLAIVLANVGLLMKTRRSAEEK